MTKLRRAPAGRPPKGQEPLPYDENHPTYDDNQAMWELLVEGVNMREIAEAVDLRRETIRLRLVRHVGQEAIDAVRDLHREVRKAREAEEREARRLRRPCFICGTEVVVQGRKDTPWVTCDDSFHGSDQIRGQARLMVDPERHQSHRVSVKKWQEAHPEIGGEQFVPVDPGKAANRRYVYPNSKMAQLIREAVQKNWPLLELLPDEILQNLVKKEREEVRKLERLESYKFGREKYPWDKWADGAPWRIVRGEDFETTMEQMQHSLHSKAKHLGMKVQTKTESKNTLVFQFFTPDDDD